MNFKWKTEKITPEYSNPYFKFSRHDVIRPNGNKNPYYVFEKNHPNELFSIIVPLTKNRETCLIGQYRYPVDYYSWEFPMGTAIKNSHLQVAKTELLEETGIKANKWKKIGEFFTAPGYSTQKAHVFLASELTYGEAHPSDSELLETKKVAILQVFSMIEEGVIKDGPTIAAAQFLSQYLKL